MPSGEGLAFACDEQPAMHAAGLCTIVDDDGTSWTYPPLCTTRERAVPFCDELVLDGHDDWRMATIDDLRTVVLACPFTASGGRCRVTEQCTSAESCWTATDCNICASAGTTACKRPFGNFGAMLSSTLSPTGDMLWTLDCARGASVLQAAPDSPGRFQCVR